MADDERNGLNEEQNEDVSSDATGTTFKAYPSIENSYREKFMGLLLSSGLGNPSVEWVATEKVHGANFSFIYDGVTLEVAKRSSLLPPTEKFCNHPVIVQKYGEGIKNIYNKLKQENPSIVSMTVYGEIFGGGYPGVESCEQGVSLVQRGVYYAPWTEFYAFDIYVKTRDASGDITGTWLAFDKALALFKENGIFCAEPLARGSLTDLLKMSPDFVTTIPARLGLPPIDNNMAEGIVLKTVIPAKTRTGNRAVLKIKSDKFSEVVHKAKRPSKPALPADKLERASQLSTTLLCYITNNRLDSVLSKVGSVTKSDTGKLIGLLSRDALQDFRKDGYGEELDKLDSELQKVVTRGLGAAARALVLKYFESQPASA